MVRNRVPSESVGMWALVKEKIFFGENKSTFLDMVKGDCKRRTTIGRVGW